MAESFSILAHTFPKSTSELDLSKDWLASRKYNGMGAIWDGGISRGKPADSLPWYKKGGDKNAPISTGLWTIGRDGKAKVVHAPNFFISMLPILIPIQGELWCNDDWSFVTSTCRSHTPELYKWIQIKFVVYNVKCYEHWNLSEKTAEYLKKSSDFYYDKGWNHNISVAEYKIYNNIDYNKKIFVPDYNTINEENDVTKMIDLAIENHWEGVMFQQFNTKYECKRSHTLLKWKPEYDAEAKIIAFEDGKSGKNLGLTGALLCEMTWDDKVISMHGGDESFIGKTVKFKVTGLEDDEHENPEEYFTIGEEIHFTFRSVSNYGVPISCNIKR